MGQVVEPFWAGARELAGRVDLCSLAERAGGWGALAASDRASLQALGVLPDVAARWLDRPAESSVGRVLTLADPDYPLRLAALSDAPPVICVHGDVQALHGPTVGVVGTRSCTPYGAAVARHLGSALAERGCVVVSGLARGIDGHAHRAAIDARTGSTVAVLGHGLPITSPASHRALRRRIVERGGAVISALPDHIGPQRWTFPQRNRWIAALSRAVVVVEAPLKSGALITATEAADLDRDLFVVPAALGQPSGAGCLQLLADGARVVTGVEALADELGVQTPQPQPTDPLLDLLIGGPAASEIARRAGEPVHTILAKLARLEVQGLVVRLPGQRFAPTRGPCV